MMPMSIVRPLQTPIESQSTSAKRSFSTTSKKTTKVSSNSAVKKGERNLGHVIFAATR
jgi:hypothetical protein